MKSLLSRMSIPAVIAAGICLSSAALAQTPRPPTSKRAPIQRSAPSAQPDGPIHAPPDCYSSQLLREQAARKELRERFDFPHMDPASQVALWDLLVGPDQINDGRGVALDRDILASGGTGTNGGGYGPRDLLVSLSWAYTQPATGLDSFMFDMNLNVQGDVSLVGTLSNNAGVTEIKATEIQGTADASSNWTQNWTRAFYYSTTPASNGYLEGKAVATDLYGNTYACGGKGDGKYQICEFSSADGSTVKLANVTVTDTGTSATIFSIVIDPEGILYVAGTYSEGNARRSFLARHDPNASLTRTWITTSDRTAGTPLRVVADRRDGILFMTTSANGKATIGKYEPYDATPDWIWQSGTNCTAEAIDLDFNGNPHITFANGSAWNTAKIDQLTGATIWTASESNGTPVAIKVDTSGNVFVVGSKGSNTTRLVKYDSTGAAASGFTPQQYGTTGAVVALALDWVGNPYVSGYYGSSTQLIDLRKFDPASGAQVWSQTTISPTGAANESNHSLTISDMLVDAGGSVYVGGYRVAYNGNTYLGTEFFCVRWEQPFVSVPQIAKANPDVRIENHSVWLPEQVDPGAGSQLLNNSFRVFNIDVDQTISDTAVTDLLTAELDYVFGTVKGQVNLNFSNNVNLGVDFVTTANGGSFDATVKGTLQVVAPGEADLTAGQPFNVLLDFAPDPKGMEMLANSTPQLSAALVSHVTGTMDLNLYAWNKNGTPTYPPPFISQNIPTPNLASLDGLTIVNLLGATPPAPGTWINYEFFGISGSFTMPDLSAIGAYSALQASGSNPNNDNDDDTLRMSSSISQEFVNASVSITDLVTEAALGFPLSFGWSLPAGDEHTNISLNVGLLQLSLNGDIKMEQDLTLDMKPYVRLEFPSASPAIAPITRNLVKRITNSDGSYSFQPESAITVTLPSATGSLEIKPYFGVNGRMTNSSGLRFGANVGFDPFNLGANFTALDVNIFTLNECFACSTFPVLNSRFNVYNYTSPWFAFGDGAAANEIELPSLFVKGDINNQPQLLGASLASTHAIFYNQRTPSQSQLNTAAGDSQPVVLYGRKFFSGTSIKGRISHQGRSEVLTTTRLNDEALLIQIPKRFFLVPGIARLWVTNNNGNSESIDFPIEYPFPNFQGVLGLDGANDPDIWAGDPRWTSTGLVAIDGGTPAGNDSFIARRDYYTYLRTTLWNSGLFASNDPNRNLSAQAYFPAFKGWELNGNPKFPPGFPSLTFDGASLSRHRPNVNDGYFRSNIQPDLIASPHVAVLTLTNPGPGGGPSRVQSVSIPAPAPVVSDLSPANYTPNTLAAGTTLRVVVSGPASVPYFAGYEAVKAGNFTPQSVVKVGNTAVATTFINSGTLAADVPASMLTTVGSRLFTVYTPWDGVTTWNERLKTGAGVLQSPVVMNSGGTSVPVTFEVLWPRPQITSLSTTSIELGNLPYTPTAVNGAAPTDDHNFGISGQNFAPGCIVYWNGHIVSSTREDEGSIRITVTDAEVARVGTSHLWVQNPGPTVRSSSPASVQIVP